MTIKIGVIGTGAIGQEHIQRLSYRTIGCEVVGIYDIQTEHAQRVLEQNNISAKVFSDPLSLIDDDNIDAIVITSPGPSHEEFVLAAIKAGKAVFCEKPLAVTAQGCLNIINAEIEYGKRLVQVGFMRPFDQSYRQLKNALQQDCVGTPLIVNCKHFNPTVDQRYTTDMAVVDTHVHEIDVLRWLLNDDYKSVQVLYPRRSSKAADHLADPQIVILETKQGIIINTEIFVNCQYGYDIQCEVIGENGVVELAEPADVFIRKDGKLQRNILIDWKKRFFEAYDVELQAFVNNIKNGEFTEGASAWDGYVAALTTDACVEAQNTGKKVDIIIPAMPSFYQK